MSCEGIRNELDDYVDEALAPGARARVAAHLETCHECAGLVADLRRLRDAARALGPIEPPEGVWRAIAERARLVPAALPPVPARPAAIRRAVAPWMGVAAALVLVAGAMVVGVQRNWGPAPASQADIAGNPDSADSVKTIAEELQLADRLYSDAIGRLEALAQLEAGGVEPAIAESLRRNQAVLDRAIAESRAALQQDPASRAARESLFEALRQKLGLLQDTVALVNDLRTGSDAAAPAVSPGKSS